MVWTIHHLQSSEYYRFCTMHVTSSHPKNNAIKKSIICIASRSALANDCLLFVLVKLAITSGNAFWARLGGQLQSYFHSGAVNLLLNYLVQSTGLDHLVISSFFVLLTEQNVLPEGAVVHPSLLRGIANLPLHRHGALGQRKLAKNRHQERRLSTKKYIYFKTTELMTHNHCNSLFKGHLSQLASRVITGGLNSISVTFLPVI